MDTETIEHQPQQVTVPFSLINEYATRESMGELGLPLLKYLALVHSPETIHQQIKDRTVLEWEAVLDVLFSEHGVLESNLWQAIMAMSFVYKNGGVDYFRSKGIEYGQADTSSTYLKKVCQESPQAIDLFMNRQLQIHSQEIDGKTIHVFELTIPRHISANFKNIEPAKLRVILQQVFENAGYGLCCNVLRVGDGSQHGFMIDHAMRMQSETRIGSNEKPVLREDRKPKTDTILYIEDLNLLWISCLNQDAQMYANVIAHLLMPRAEAPKRKDFALDHLLEKTLKARLSRTAGNLALPAIELRAFNFQTPRGSDTKLPAKKPGCIADLLENEPDVGPGGKLKEIKLRVRTGAETRDYGTITLKPSTMKIERNLDPRIVSTVLVALGIWQTRADA